MFVIVHPLYCTAYNYQLSYGIYSVWIVLVHSRVHHYMHTQSMQTPFTATVCSKANEAIICRLIIESGQMPFFFGGIYGPKK